MKRTDITPVVLTWNEAENIARTLEHLGWAERVLVVDSGSDDGTQEISRRFGNVTVVERRFDVHAAQWEFGIRHPSVTTDWVLALDADYVLTPELEAELTRIDLSDPATSGFRVRFRYCIDGQPLRASLYPPAVVLYDRRRARYVQVGHTQRLEVVGRLEELHGSVLHDDRKPFCRFLERQRHYALLEARQIRRTPFGSLSWSGRLRRLRFIAPIFVPCWLLVGKGLIFDGRRGLRYVKERVIAEMMISRALGEHDRDRAPAGRE